MVETTNTTHILDKRSILISSNNNGQASVFVAPDKEKEKKAFRYLGSLSAGVITKGFLLGTEEGKKLPDILRECSSLKVRDMMESIDGYSTYVLEGQGKEGKIALWLDPNAGYQPRRVESYKTGTDLLYGEPLASDRNGRPEMKGKQLKEYSVICDSIKIDDINNVFLMTAGKMTETRTYMDKHKVVIATDFYISNIDLNPDFDVLKPFEIKVPDGTPVSDGDFPGGKFEVRQGKIVSAGTAFEEIDKTIDQLKQQQ